MVNTGLGFGLALVRAGVLPFVGRGEPDGGVVTVALTQTAPEGVQLVADGIRAAAFVGMGFALLHRRIRPRAADYRISLLCLTHRDF